MSARFCERKGRSVLLTAAMITLVTCFSACDKDNENETGFDYGTIKPKGQKPAWGPSITGQMQAVIEAFDTLAPTPIFQLTPEQARLQPSAADAAMRVMSNYGIAMPPMNVDTTGVQIPVDGGSIHARVYTPKTTKNIYPVIVYYHGGGWVIATIDTYNSSAQALAEKTGAVVVSVEYRKGPEYKFPTAHNDAYAAYKWVLANSAVIKGDSTKVAVAGESAGGNLAVTVSMMARDDSMRMPVHQLAVYPVASDSATTESKQKFTDAKPLATPALPWFLGYYLNNITEAADPRISLVKGNLSGLPKTTIIAAELDPLQSEGKQLADLLNSAGVSVKYQLYNGVTHEFFGMASVVPEAKSAQDFAADQIKGSFN